MRKLVSLIILISVLLGTFSFTLGINVSANLYKTGDVNRDGNVNSIDSLLIKKNISDQTSILESGDIDKDGQISAKDNYYIKSSISGISALTDNFGWKGFTLNGESIDGCYVVITNPDNQNMCYAADKLSSYIGRDTGYTSKLINDTEYSPNKYDKAFVLIEGDKSVYGNDGFNISVNGSIVTLTVAPLRGSNYAVYEIIKNYFGYKFYGKGDIELVYEDTKDIADGINDTQIPVNTYRSNGTYAFSDPYVETSTIPNNLNAITTCYSLDNPKYGYGITRLWANAHSFEYFISSNPKHCLTLESNYTTCLENMRKLIIERTNAGAEIGKSITEISCSYAADEDYCLCRNCSKIYKANNYSYAGVLVRFVNRIDNALKAEFPDITVITNAYSAVRKPPTQETLNDDIILLYCWNACTNHDIGTGECKEYGKVGDLGSNYVEEKYFEGWVAHSSRIYVWYYPTNIYYMLCPQPNFFKIYNDFKWFNSHKEVEGYYIAATAASSFEILDTYLINNMMWDTEITYDEYTYLMQEYLKTYYGYGWIYIYEYMQMLDECGNLKGCVLNDYDHPFDIYDIDYFRDNYSKMCELFDKAMDLAETQSERYNLTTLSIHMKFLGLTATYERDYVNGDSITKAEYAKEWENVYNYINTNNIRVTYDRIGIDEEFTLSKSPMQLVYNISGIR